MWDDFIDALVDVLLYIPRQVYELIFEAIQWFLTLLPSTGFNVQQAINGWPSDIIYFMNVIEFGYGLTALFTALSARFILRRIPVIG